MLPENSELSIEFGFIIGKRVYKGRLDVSDGGHYVGLELVCDKIIPPLELEKALYQLAHIVAERTETLSLLREEKINIWT